MSHTSTTLSTSGFVDERNPAVGEIDDRRHEKRVGEYCGDRKHDSSPRRAHDDHEQADRAGDREGAEVAGGVRRGLLFVTEHQRGK